MLIITIIALLMRFIDSPFPGMLHEQKVAVTNHLNLICSS